MTRLITTSAPNIYSHVLRVSKFVPRELTGSAPTGPSSEEKKKERRDEERREEKIRTKRRKGREGPRGRRKRRFVPFGSVRRRLTQRGYRGRLDGHIEGARST